MGEEQRIKAPTRTGYPVVPLVGGPKGTYSQAHGWNLGEEGVGLLPGADPGSVTLGGQGNGLCSTSAVLVPVELSKRVPFAEC